MIADKLELYHIQATADSADFFATEVTRPWRAAGLAAFEPRGLAFGGPRPQRFLDTDLQTP